MPSNSTNERLNLLTDRVTKSLRSLSGRSTLLASTLVSFHSGALRELPLTERGNAASGITFLGDERQMRALAKEIKRLISEDTRRGLKI